jgi:hypothetical protein
MGKKGSILVKLPMQLYVSLHDRQLNNHISFLVSRLLEEFLKATDVRISWAEMPTKAEQRKYLKRKLQEFLSGAIEGRPERVSKKTEEDSWKEPTPSLSEANREEVKTEKEKKEEKKTEEEEQWDSEERRKAEFLKRFEQFW